VFKKARQLGDRHVVIIDEAHLVPHDGEGMYQKLLGGLRDAVPDLRVVGFTATPYRLGSGRLDHGDGRLFSQTVYSYGIGQGIKDGYLSPLMSKRAAAEIDISGVAKRGGEFVAGSLEMAADVDEITQAATAEIVQFGEARRSWLVFCSGVAHAYHVRDAIRARGISCETITGDTPSGQRDAYIKGYREGRIRCLTNANVLTTGFDAPATDLVVMLRPTLSTGLYVQMVGRGTRTADGKENCLILDFAGNVRRHGPVDSIEIKPKRQKKDKDEDQEDVGKAKVGDVKAKECPQCKELVAIATRHCPHCDYEWPVDETPKHQDHADAETPILSTEKLKPEEVPVVSWEFGRHEKPGKPYPTLRVTYLAGLQSYREWLGFEQVGFPQSKAHRWWFAHGGKGPAPNTVSDAMARGDELTRPYSIMVRPSGKYFEIVGRKIKEATNAN
jgi:DNA repair protein RadD